MCGSTYYCRTLIEANDPLHLRFRCECGLFGQMAHVALPGLTHAMARSKKVMDMFQLANVASVSEEQCWGDEKKETELRRKNSQFITSYGLALAMDGHRRRCQLYAKRLAAAKGVRYEHPAIFPWAVHYNLSEIVMEAISMLEQLESPAPARSTERDVFIAVPVAFAKVNAEIGYEDNITVYIYTDFGTLANKLLNHAITKSIIVIWPQTMPESRPMRQLLISLERHLADGGALAFFPFPYEDSNAAEWRRMGEVCREFTRYITDPRRNFEALVRDHYSDVLDAAPYTHPAVCLGTTPRRNSTSTLTDKQMLLFLEKMRITIADLIRLPEFDFASTQLREQRAREKARARKRQEAPSAAHNVPSHTYQQSTCQPPTPP
ncbi:unnamed protein product [Cylicocyclus nassatus]|uniref:Uncharacterized protein n=1 Tax=Cylicocyclus nassatus TaxID=53992 RepID=A0AA36DW41_CYLNA|nr:unnamed protein product [Cylicocyclus nassatus]